MDKKVVTLEYIQTLANYDPAIKNFLRRLEVASYDDFLDVLYDDLMIAIERLEQSPHLYMEECEDATTQRLLDIMHGMNYGAYHNLQLGGNVDLTIELRPGAYKWIGEAKRFTSIGDMREGYLQLSSRYKPGSGSVSKVHGGLLGYLRRPNAAACMNSWRDHYVKEVMADSSVSACERRGPLAFFSEHSHSSMGLPFRVWHVCIVLHFEPEDKSARSSKRHGKKARELS